MLIEHQQILSFWNVLNIFENCYFLIIDFERFHFPSEPPRVFFIKLQIIIHPLSKMLIKLHLQIFLEYVPIKTILSTACTRDFLLSLKYYTWKVLALALLLRFIFYLQEPKFYGIQTQNSYSLTGSFDFDGRGLITKLRESYSEKGIAFQLYVDQTWQRKPSRWINVIFSPDISTTQSIKDERIRDIFVIAPFTVVFRLLLDTRYPLKQYGNLYLDSWEYLQKKFSSHQVS